MASVLEPDTLDSFETLCRAYVEARDLLVTFRFDDKGARDKIRYWFAGEKDNAWKADHTKSDEFLTRLGANGIQLAENWSKLSVLSHPTKYASENSAVVIVSRVAVGSRSKPLPIRKPTISRAYPDSLMAVTYDLPGWISLGCDENRMPHVEDFRAQAEQITAPILNAPVNHGLPETSIRTAKKKNAP